ncbi:MAG: hypothetical protein AAF513_14955 [Pseudomonadota bacterium]
MLIEIDRLQLATPDPAAAIERWQAIVDAEVADKGRIRALQAITTTLRVGRSEVEILAADGSGLVADAIARRGAHMFSAGASTQDVRAVQAQLSPISERPILEDGRLYVDGADIGIPGLRLVVSPHAQRESVGLIDYLYEATVLAADADGLTARFAEVFALDARDFAQIESPRFGYEGKLTLFRSEELHRFEVITPLDPDKTMGRFFNKIGACLYMSFAETSALMVIEERVASAGLGQTIDRPEDRTATQPADQIWLHPATLGGVMLGLSRPTMAWSWSGKPDRVEAVPTA